MKNTEKYHSEKYLEKTLKEEVKKIGGLCIKLHSSTDAGMPDRLILHRGKAVFVELKSKGKKLSPLQEHYRKRLEQVGHTLYLVDSLDTLKQVLAICQA